MDLKPLAHTFMVIVTALAGCEAGFATSVSSDTAAATQPVMTEEQAYANLYKTEAAMWHAKGDTGPIVQLNVQSKNSSEHWRPLNDDDLRSIAAFKHLQSLSISDAVKITDHGVAYLKGLKELEDFSLDDSQVTDAGLSVLETFPRLTSVEITRDQKIDDQGLVHLEHMVKLRFIDLSHTSVTGAGLKYLEGLKELGEVRLEGTKVKDGLEHLEALPLGHLLLMETGVDDDAIKPIEKMTHLRELDLTATHITDAGLAHLKGLSDLQVLWLDNTDITDAGLAQLKGLHHLGQLWVDQTWVTSDGVASLQKALPTCRISDYHLKVAGKEKGAHVYHSVEEKK